ncbi:MAG: hypothetical protein M1821_003109 [Bathelium mastoideum]|nr:MAG: hypothetical protein M1821_003109 [Bathelium mastoideum]
MFFSTAIVAISAITSLASAHTVITYPGWRGDNLQTNGSVLDTSIGIDVLPNGTNTFPWGMQWMYPCGGMPLSQNRTKWPVSGGAVAFQPGWFPGHLNALIYINMGIGTVPPNMSHIMQAPVNLLGPTNVEYNGTVCFPQVPMPANITFNVGDNVTIQVVEAAQHGAALYNCVDVTLADPSEVVPVTPQNCFNSSDIGFDQVFTTTSLQESAASLPMMNPTSLSLLIPLFVTFLPIFWS